MVVAPFLGWVGYRCFVLPNPISGRWLLALYHKDRAKTPAERRRQIYQHLQY
jgi:hypothetical protein